MAVSPTQIISKIYGDRLPAIVLAILILVLGIQPSLMVRWSESTAKLLTPFPASKSVQALKVSRQVAIDSTFQVRNSDLEVKYSALLVQ